MQLKVGIVGLPNAGKSTLFNALVTKPKAGVAQHPFTTIDKNIGVVSVPNDTLFELAKIENIGKVTPTSITFVDIAGLIKGAHKGEGLGNQFLHYIREVDLILHVVRFFKNESIPHLHSKVDPEDDIAIVNEELFLADLQSIERKLEKDKISEEERKVYKKCMEQLNKEQSVSQMEMNDKEKYLVKALNLLSAKKQLIVANIDEDEVGKDPKKINGEPTLPVSAKLEAELNEYPWVEQQKLLKDLGLKKSAREEVIKAAYQALNLITFYTIAKRTEARAWPIMQGVDAVHAAGKIHTDFAKHFVKVEAINAQELILLGSWHKAHEAGKVITHGRDYIVRDQDVLEFKVSLKER